MPYSPTQWKDHIVQFPNRFSKTDNPDGTFDLQRVEGDIFQEGTPISAANLQKIDDEVARLSSLVDQQQLDIANLKNRMQLVESTFPDSFTNNLFTEDLVTLNAIVLTRGYYNEAMSRLEV